MCMIVQTNVKSILLDASDVHDLYLIIQTYLLDVFNKTIKFSFEAELRVILRIDNGSLALISLRFTFLLIASWLFGPYRSTIHRMKAEIISY